MGPGTTVVGFCSGVGGCGHAGVPGLGHRFRERRQPLAKESPSRDERCRPICGLLQTTPVVASSSQTRHRVEREIIVFLLVRFFSSVPGCNLPEPCRGSHLCECLLFAVTQKPPAPRQPREMIAGTQRPLTVAPRLARAELDASIAPCRGEGRREAGRRDAPSRRVPEPARTAGPAPLCSAPRPHVSAC